MTAKTTAQRVEAHRKRVIEGGGWRGSVTLTPESKRAADELIESGYAGSMTAAINRSLCDMAESVRKK